MSHIIARLVEEQHRRVADQAGGQVKPPAHAAGVGLDRASGRLGQAEALEQLVRALPGARRGQPAELADHDQVGPAGEVLVQRRVLTRQADDAADLRRRGDHVVAQYLRPAPVRAQQRGEHADGRGLAGAVRAEQAVDGAGRYGKVEPGQCLGLPVGLHQPHRLDGGSLGHPCTPFLVRCTIKYAVR
jgi:hypothetical protein